MAHRRHTKAIVTQRDGFMLARIESSDRAFEVNLDAIEPAGETLGLYRDDERVERISNFRGKPGRPRRLPARTSRGREAQSGSLLV
jgi:hypothetical protein